MTAGESSLLVSPATVLAAMELPAAAMVQQRVPKKLLVEHGASTAADKRLINDAIESIYWLASLKPGSVGVPAYVDPGQPSVRKYLELAVISIVSRPTSKVSRIAELVHRAIPYPVFLLLEQADSLTLSVAHIRWAQNDSGKIIVDGPMTAVKLSESTPKCLLRPFLDALALSRLPRSDLFALVQGLINVLTRMQAAELMGRFPGRVSLEEASSQRAAIQRCIDIDKTVAELRGSAAKEKQLPRQVAINLEIKRLQAERSAAVRVLASGDNS